MSRFCPVITPTTCGEYMQPCWLSSTGVVGTCQFLSGRPDLTHTNAFLRVPLPLTTTSSDFTGAPACAFSQKGVADMSSVFIVGAVPSKATLPVTVAPLASSGVAEPPAAGAVLSAVFGASVFSPLPQPASVNAHASPAVIKKFFIVLRASI